MVYTKDMMSSWLRDVEKLIAHHPDWYQVFENGFTDTLDRTVEVLDDGTCFVLTGDIPAMWLRDSTAQIKPYVALAKEDKVLAQTILGVLKRQFAYILQDPYANAFNAAANGHGHQTDKTEMSDWIWERKYEIDSLCYPIHLAYIFWQKTGEVAQFDASFWQVVRLILDVWTTEQHHENSPYTFERPTDRLEDTLSHDGRGNPCAYTGMTWSGFRPSDDACVYPYLIPSNMFAVVVLSHLEEIIQSLRPEEKELLADCQRLRSEIDAGIKQYGIVKNQSGESIYAYEVDGLGHYSIMDDPNVPSLLAAPYLGYCASDDPIYQATRRTILSAENPYYFEGKYAKGLGSTHTFTDYIWPIALAIQGLTTDSLEEKAELLDTMVACDGGAGQMHESFHVDDPKRYSREWFSWANMMFCELVLDFYAIKEKD